MNNREPYEYGKNNSNQNGSESNYGSRDFSEELGKMVGNAMNLGTTIMREMNREFSEFSNQFSGEQQGSRPQQQVDELRRSAQNLGNTVMHQVSRSMDDLSDRLRSTAAQPPKTAPKPQPPRPPAQPRSVPVYNRPLRPMRAPGKIKAGLSYLVGTGSSVGALCFGATAASIIFAGVNLVGGAAAFAAAFVCGFVSVRCFQAPAWARRRFRYFRAMGTDKTIPLARLAESAQCSVKRVKRDLSRMIRKNMLPEGYIDEEEQILFLDAEEYRLFQHRQEQQRRSQQPANPGEELLFQMEAFVRQMDEHILQNEQEPVLAQRLTGLRRTTADILGWVKNNPSKSNQVRRLTSYYIPTTLKLLKAYEDAKGQPGETAQGIRRDVTEALENIKNGFENLRTSLLTDTALDVAAEISAVQTMLVQDGMADPIFEFKE